jgi:hypothetical protein
MVFREHCVMPAMQAYEDCDLPGDAER